MAPLNYDVTFQDFRFLQGHMTRRIFARNRRKFGAALFGIVLSACFIAAAIVINVNPYRAGFLSNYGVRYPLSFYLAIIICLFAAILFLIPAARLRLRMLRLQVSDDGPYLGPTQLNIEPDGLIVERRYVRSKYLWAAFQGVEIASDAVILPIDNGIGIIVPASAFSSDAGRFQFASAVSKHLEARRVSQHR